MKVDLRQTVALEMWCVSRSDRARALAEWPTMLNIDKAHYFELADAALAAVIPAIHAEALERAAEEAFNEYLAAENDVETAGQSDVVARLQSEGAASAANRIMQAIRALKEGT